MRKSPLVMLMATASLFGGTINFNINTSAVAGSLLRVAFDITTSTPVAFSCFANCVSIANFNAPGSTMQLPDTTGGLITGDLILLDNPASFTYIDKGFAYNNLTVNLSPVGNLITFALTYTEAGPTGGDPPDQIALFLLDNNYLPLFPTADPLGADALLSIDLTGAPGGVRNVYGPATIVGDNVSIIVPGAATGIPEPSSLALVAVGILAFGIGRRSFCRERRRS